MRIYDTSPGTQMVTEARTANLLAYLAIAEARGGTDEDTRRLDRTVRARLGLLTDEEATR